MATDISQYIPQSKVKSISVIWNVMILDKITDKTFTRKIETWWRFNKERFDATMEVIQDHLNANESLVMTLDYAISPEDRELLNNLGIKTPEKAAIKNTFFYL